MAIGVTLRATACASCRLNLLQSSISITGHSTQPFSLSQKLYRTTAQAKTRFSTQVAPEEKEDDAEVAQEVKQTEWKGAGTTQTSGASVEVSALPWYLQVQAPRRAMQPISEKQRIPDLPEMPPPILGPLLQQISVDLGIDNLSLLDLRKLDPPPALGANLLMIIGTARSEKHLHVSADRLCRWLRSTYKLRPDADGLLGRNELKLKLKRKTRRAKLTGSAIDDNGDDGVRTGWVCVDVGLIEGPEGHIETNLTPATFIGFGRRTDGVRMVVQMLTEEKREEIDLETLWGGQLRRSLQAKSIALDNDVDYMKIAPTASSMGNGPIPSLT